MYGEHVIESLSVYLNGGLSKNESELVADHLIGCSRCRLEFEQIKVEAALVEKQLVLDSGRQLSGGFAATRSDSPRLPVRDHAEEIKGWFKKLENRYFTVALVIAVAISSVALYVMHAPVSVPSLPVVTTAGAPVLGAIRVRGSVDFELGQWLETDSVSSATVSLPRGAQLTIAPETRLGLLELDQKEIRLLLQHGEVKAAMPTISSSGSEEQPVLIDTPSGSLSGHGAYTVVVDDGGVATVRVQSGVIEARLAGKRSIVLAGAICEMRPQLGPGAPFFDDASAEFKQALETFDFGTEDRSHSAANAVEVLSKAARERDALTLWHLLDRVNESQRQVVFDKLNQLAPAPPEAGNAAFNTDRRVLEKWLTEIEQRARLR